MALKAEEKERGYGILTSETSDTFSELCFLVITSNSKGQNVALILHFRILFSFIFQNFPK